MFDDGPSDESLEETVRSIAREVGRSIERAMDRVEVDALADAVGADPDVAREWVDSAAGWLRAHAESLGDELAFRVAGSRPVEAREGPWLGALPHPLDPPTEEQGLALAALDSGRWAVEPGTKTLAAKEEGPAPSDALGIVRELRVRDWIAADGEITLAGRHALSRWLDGATPS
jgi:hypothetical protein